MMKSIIAVTLSLASIFVACREEDSNPIANVSSQITLDQTIHDIVNQTNLDSITTSVKQLTGAASVTIDGITDTITSRYPAQKGHALAVTYLTQKLASYGLTPLADSFNTASLVTSNRAVNITARMTGTEFPTDVYIICAHYDAIAFAAAPGADDNGSGTAAVLEAARILSHYQTKYTLVFALWDQEEEGYFGSSYYVNNIPASGDSIMGVVNIDMIGYDSNDDGMIDIHTANVGWSVPLADTLVYIINRYGLALDPVVHNPGADNSDNGPFWWNGYSAVAYSEAHNGGDFNPYYHTVKDKIDYFNSRYFLNCSKLGVAAISLLGAPSPK